MQVPCLMQLLSRGNPPRPHYEDVVFDRPRAAEVFLVQEQHKPKYHLSTTSITRSSPIPYITRSLRNTTHPEMNDN